MGELISKNQDKEKKYQEISKLARALLSPQDHTISQLSNLSALLYRELNFWWVGFYLVDESKKELYLGPFQGPTACTKIPYGKGVCGSAWQKAETIIVPDVHQFAGHIACSSESNSEIVVPLKKDGKVTAVLDVDSTHFNHFDNIDKKFLEEMLSFIS
jgi:L-methionine (R)-S-oxide reductase